MTSDDVVQFYYNNRNLLHILASEELLFVLTLVFRLGATTENDLAECLGWERGRIAKDLKALMGCRALTISDKDSTITISRFGKDLVQRFFTDKLEELKFDVGGRWLVAPERLTKMVAALAKYESDYRFHTLTSEETIRALEAVLQSRELRASLLSQEYELRLGNSLEDIRKERRARLRSL